MILSLYFTTHICPSDWRCDLLLLLVSKLWCHTVTSKWIIVTCHDNHIYVTITVTSHAGMGKVADLNKRNLCLIFNFDFSVCDTRAVLS